MKLRPERPDSCVLSRLVFSGVELTRLVSRLVQVRLYRLNQVFAFDAPKEEIAAVAQQSANLAGVVAVVDIQSLVRVVANCASTLLEVVDRVVVARAHPKCAPQVIALKDGVFTSTRCLRLFAAVFTEARVAVLFASALREYGNPPAQFTSRALLGLNAWLWSGNISRPVGSFADTDTRLAFTPHAKAIARVGSEVCEGFGVGAHRAGLGCLHWEAL